MLSSLNLNINSDFQTLSNFFSQEYKKAEESVRVFFAELTDEIQSEEEEAVVTISARLESKIKDLNFIMPPKDLKELFLGGLEPELQNMVRNKLKGCISEILKVDENERECMKLKLIVKMNIDNFNKLENAILDPAAEI